MLLLRVLDTRDLVRTASSSTVTVTLDLVETIENIPLASHQWLNLRFQSEFSRKRRPWKDTSKQVVPFVILASFNTTK